MSTTIDELPSRVERKVSNRNGDTWYEYDGEPLFADEGIARLRERFTEMVESDWEKVATVKGSSSTRTKIRTKDADDFADDVRDAADEWVEVHGSPLTNIGNIAYVEEEIDSFGVVGIDERRQRRTDVRAEYTAGYRAFIGGADGKKQNVLLPVRGYEQWSFHTEVVEPLFTEYHEKYPY